MRTTVSGCYQNNGSKTTVSVEVSWDNASISSTVDDASDAITVTFAGQTKTINPGPYSVGSGIPNQIISPQVVAFEVPANASSQTVQAFFGASYAASTCRAEQTNILLPAACPITPCPTVQITAAATATSSSVLTGFGPAGPQLAIDGNTNGVFSNQSVFHSAVGDANPFWQMEFATPQVLDAIVIWNRTDCCGERLNGAIVEVLDASNTVLFSQTIGTAVIENEITFSTVLGKKIRIRKQSATTPFAIAEVQVFGSNGLGGVVFNDNNGDGIKNPGETTGLGGVTVKAFNSQGTLLETVTTDAFGGYLFSGIASSSYPIRVEFSNLPAEYGQGTVNGNNGKTTTQFVASPNCNVSLGVLTSSDYCQNNPLILVPCYLNGDPADPGSATDAAIVSVNYDLTGSKTAIAKIPEVGATWGIAYNRHDKFLYSAALLRRHAGLASGGLGGIYKSNVLTNATSLLVDVSTLPGVNIGTIGSNASRGLGSKTQTSRDSAAFEKVGKTGLGDIDISADGQTLYFVNLFEKKLHRLSISSPTAAPGVAIPDPGCSGGTYRPFALKIYKGKAYVGVVCDAQTSQNKSNLRAFVYQYDLNSNTFNTTPVLDFPLTYPKGFVSGNTTALNKTGWYPWSDAAAILDSGFLVDNSEYGRQVVYPMPILSDIEFDIDGSMVLGFMDRFGLQTGTLQPSPNSADSRLFGSIVGGDILRAYFNNNTFVLENAAKAGPSTGYGPTNNQGPGFGEFYNDDFFYENKLAHAENSQGGLAIKPGSGSTVYSAMDPVTEVIVSGGVRLVNNQTGQTTSAYTIVTGGLPNGLFSKSASIGDVELSCDLPLFIEIGNRVWNDVNKNGVQDPNEKALKNVNVSLYKGTTKIATTVTNTNGEYYFSTAFKIGAGTWLGTGADTTLLPSTAYKLVFGEGQINGSQLHVSGLGKFELTLKDATASSGNDQNDSDVEIIAGAFCINLMTGVSGSVNHTFDAGFYCINPPIKATFIQTFATCTNITENNDGKVALAAAVTPYDKFRVKTGTGAWTGDSTYATATAVGSTFPKDLITGIPNAGATYTIRFYIGECCYKDTTLLVAPQSCNCTKPVVTATPKNQTICAGETPESYDVFADPVKYPVPLTYTWYGPLADTTSSLGTAITGQTTSSFTPTGAAIATAGIKYYAVVVNNTGDAACADTAFVQLVVNAKPSIADGSATICVGASVDLTSRITNYATFLSPVWTVGTAGGTAVTTPTSVAPTSTTTYVLVAQNAAGCKDTANVVVTVNPKPNAGKDTTLVCVNATTNTLATSYTLVPSPSGGTWAQIGTTPATATITGNNVTNMTVAGTYQFVYTTTAGCKDTVSVTVAPCAGCVKPNAGPDAAAVCQPTSTAKLTAVTMGGTWSAIGSPSNPSAAAIDASGNITGLSAAGTYRFVYSVTSGGITCTDTAQVVVNAKPSIADGSATICVGASVDLTSRITNYATFLSPVWTVGTAGGTAVTTPTSVAPTSTTTYVLVAQNAAGCKDTANVVVTVNPKPNAGKDTTLVCVNATTNTLATSYTLVPSPSGGTWAQIGTTPATATITGNNVTNMTVAGTYQFVYTTTAGCKDTVSVTVAPCAGCVKPNAGPDAAAVCQPTSTAKLTAVTMGGTWAAIGSPSNPSAAAIDASGNITGLSAAGTYRFVYSVTSGGITCTDTAQVVVNAKPSIADGSATICVGASVDLTSRITNYATFLSPVWTVGTAGGTAVTTPTSVAPTSTTTYVLVAQNAAGCKDTANVVVTVNPKPNAGKDTTLVCVNATTNTLATSYTLVPSPSGGTWAQIGTTPATATITGNNVTNMTVAGTYQFVYTTTAGCKDTVSVTVAPCAGCVKPNAGPDAAAVCQPTSTAKLTAVTMGGTWSAIGSPSNPSAAAIDASGNITGLSAAGTYRFVYSVTSGGITCTDTAQVVVNAKPSIADGSATICVGASVDLTSRITNYATFLSPVWTVGTAGGTAVTTPTSVAPTSTTTYVLVAQNAAGCKDTANVVVTVNPKPNAGKDTTLVCVNATTNTLATSYTLVPSPSGGTWAQIGTTPATATITGNNVTNMTVAGTYQFVYTTTAGCKDTVSVTVAPCAGCVKPNAGPDAAAVCQPTSTAKLTAVTMGGTWSAIGSPSNPSAAAIDANGNITGLSAAGTYRFVYSVTSGGITCTDTAQVVVNAKPIIADGSATICVGASVDLTSRITNYATFLSPVWTVGTAGGTAVTTPTSVAPTSTTTYVLVAQNAAGCRDTAQVVVTVTPKPSAGQDVTLPCNGVTAPSTVDLTDALAGQKWKVLQVQPGTTVSITTPAGVVTGMTVPGQYRFLLQNQSDSLVCRDTVSVIVPDCSCPTINVLTPNATVCKDSLWPTLSVSLTGTNSTGVTVQWFGQAVGGTSLGSGLSFTPTGKATVTDTFYVALSGAPSNCSGLARVPVIVTVQNCKVEVDLALKKAINKKIAQIGDTLIYTIKVFNQSSTAATGVEVTDSIATTVAFIAGSFSTTRGTASIVGNVIKWNIGNIAANSGANGDTVTLTYKIKVTNEGVHFNTAEISKTNEKDIDSTPNNGQNSEDDLDRQCFTVPFKLCAGEKVQASAPAYLTNVQWYKDGGSTPIVSGNTVLLSEVGTYTFTAANQTCPAGGCCPIIIEAGDNCCPTQICIPFTITKKKK